jgi:hypothetical protein
MISVVTSLILELATNENVMTRIPSTPLLKLLRPKYINSIAMLRPGGKRHLINGLEKLKAFPRLTLERN